MLCCGTEWYMFSCSFTSSYAHRFPSLSCGLNLCQCVIHSIFAFYVLLSCAYPCPYFCLGHNVNNPLKTRTALDAYWEGNEKFECEERSSSLLVSINLECVFLYEIIGLDIVLK